MRPLLLRVSGEFAETVHMAMLDGGEFVYLDQVRRRGYALDLEENEPGARCVAVPVFLGRTAPVAAVSVTALKDRMPPASPCPP
ncbi:IclR family transcriptional regulator C-terminal domain-containing protein [Nonomuraea angiospora]|uniref:IclR family transcriptional regulator domain-containing protein n=1 Tax=Nonomuraea angiospora TaxID=46172 RepID=UPI0037AB6F2B